MNQKAPHSAPPVVLLDELIGALMADTEAAAAARASGIPRGPVTGLQKLDGLLGGYLAPGLHVLQGGPGAGKTALALQIASRCYYPCLYVTSEMPLLELFRRLVARETQTYLNKLKTGELGAKETQRLALQTVERLPRFAFMDGTHAHAEPSLIYDAADGLRVKADATTILVVIDSLQMWALGARSSDQQLSAATEYDLINSGLDAAAVIASRLACPVLMISHRNRAGQKDGGLHSSKGSGSIEYLAESLIDLSTKRDQPQPDKNSEIEITLSIHKNRHGVAGTNISLLYSGGLQTFREAGE